MQRIKRFNFRPDRNDVILPASLLTQEILKITKQNKVLIPGVGLREGLIASLSETISNHLHETDDYSGASDKGSKCKSTCYSTGG